MTVSRRVAGLAALAVGVGLIALLGRPGFLGPASSVAPTGRDPGFVAGPQGVGADARLLAAVPIVRLARVVAPIGVADAAGGKAILDGEGHGLTLEAGWRVAIFDGPVVVGEESWYRVYALANPNAGPTEFFGWMPLRSAAGGETLAIEAPPICPDGRGISVLGALDPFTRARCIDQEHVELHGWTWDRMLPSWYTITPEWMGNQNGGADSTISINEDRRHPGANGVGPFPFLEVQMPPGLESPPLEFEVELTAHVGDPTSRTCIRAPGANVDLPVDEPASGPLWCTTRLVAEAWVPINGPEQRPIDRSSPQLHRHPDRGPNSACGGVGMPPLVFHMDAAQLDPIWLEAVGFPLTRIIPNFDPGFRVVVGAGLAIVDEAGHLVARDGTPVDPDGDLAGHSICPTGRVVYFD
jgi:hypothetical protein